MNIKTEINKIINEYEKFEELFENNDGFDKGYSLDDYDELYKVWLDKISETFTEELEDDLVGLCEDNEVMKEAINEYFAENMET